MTVKEYFIPMRFFCLGRSGRKAALVDAGPLGGFVKVEL